MGNKLLTKQLSTSAVGHLSKLIELNYKKKSNLITEEAWEAKLLFTQNVLLRLRSIFN